MTTVETHAPGTAAGVAGRGLSGVADWLTTTDHKKIGRLYLLSGMMFLAAVAVVGVLLGVDRADTSRALLDPGSLPQVLSTYRVGLVMAAIAPIVLGMAVAVVPLQVGARSLAFPRLVATGFWSWLIGTVVVVVSIASNGGPAGGNATFVALFLTAHLLQLLGLLCAVVGLATTILTTRAPGMNMRRVPVFTWSVLVACVGLLVALPVVAGNAIIAYVDYRYGREGFGGNRGISDLIGFGLTQPMTFLWAVPAFGFALEALTTATRRRLAMRGAAFAGLGLLAVGAFTAVTQTPLDLPRNAFDQGLGDWLTDAVPFAFFHLLPVLGGLVVLAIGASSLRSVRPRLQSPMVFGLLGAGLAFVGVAGTALYNIGDAQLAGTVFEESMTLYVVYGTALAMLGAVVYWCPKLTGRATADTKVLPLALLGALGVVLAALPYAIAGFAKQPAAAMQFSYSGPYQLWNIASAIGHLLVALTVLGVVAMRLGALRGGAAAGDDPWDGQTLEWATSSPAPEANFADVHTVMSPEPLLDLKPGGQR